MKIIAESRPVTGMPFVHLGYASASPYTPSGKVLLTGLVLIVAGVRMMRKAARRHRRGEALAGAEQPPSKAASMGRWLLLAGVALIPLAWVAGGYPEGERATYSRMSGVMRHIYRKMDGASESGDSNPIRRLPTRAGVYDLAEAADDEARGYRFRDGWNVPMKLKVVVTDGGKLDYLLMSAGEDRKWGTEDDLTSAKYADEWRDDYEAEAAFTSSPGTAPTSQEEDQPE